MGLRWTSPSSVIRHPSSKKHPSYLSILRALSQPVFCAGHVLANASGFNPPSSDFKRLPTCGIDFTAPAAERIPGKAPVLNRPGLMKLVNEVTELARLAGSAAPFALSSQ